MKDYLIDTHAHLDMLDEPVETVLEEMNKAGVKKVVIPSVEEKTMDRVFEIAMKDENIFAMTGIFPSEARSYSEKIESKMKKLAKNPKIRAIGEIGLDYYWDRSFIDIQKKVFIRQIKLANSLGLPIVIHDREAHRDVFDILKKENKGSKVLFHCFSGSAEFMRECTREGWSIAVGGVVTFKNAVKIKEAAASVPIDKLMLETDSPYLTPVPFRGKPNKPAYVRYVAEETAKIRGMDLNELISRTTENAEEFFSI